MFRDVPGCWMFHVPGFIDGLASGSLNYTWQNTLEHIPSRCVAQFFLRASSQSPIFGFRCKYNMIRIKVIVYVFPTDKKRSIFTYGKARQRHVISGLPQERLQQLFRASPKNNLPVSR